jgi:hypothetical protein
MPEDAYYMLDYDEQLVVVAPSRDGGVDVDRSNSPRGGDQAAGSRSDASSFSGLHARRYRPHRHRLRRERHKQIMRVGFRSEPALVSRARQDKRHAVVELRDELVGWYWRAPAFLNQVIVQGALFLQAQDIGNHVVHIVLLDYDVGHGRVRGQ